MSWQLRLLNLILRRIARPRLLRTKSPRAARRDMDQAARLFFRQPPFLRHVRGTDGRHWIKAGRYTSRRVILYFHGGGYIAGGPHTHAGLLGRLSKLTQIEICAPEYPLSPEAPFPAAVEAAIAAFQGLERLGYQPNDIALGGDSAGGGLCLAVLSWCCWTGRVPAAAFLLSPWTDLTASGDSLTVNAASDTLLPAKRIDELIGYYLQGADPSDPRASPLFADFPGCPPVLLQFSEGEILRDDSRRMADRLRDFGGQVTVQSQPDAPHVWHIFDGWVPEARASLRRIATFLHTAFAEAKR